MAAPDRLALLVNQTRFTGIDFVRAVEPEQTKLEVYFLVAPDTLTEPLTDLQPSQIDIHSVSGGERLARVPVASVVLNTLGERAFLEVTTTEPGDFSLYRLFIDDDRIDRFFNDVEFSFKQACPSDLDCKEPPLECPPEAEVDFPVDYLARDFESFRRALLDFARQRYPDWVDGLDADMGVMLLEVMSALGDELSYIQDQYARESHFSTATQRSSVRRHARLIDYEIHDGRLASTFLFFEVSADTVLEAGARVAAVDSDGRRVVFEVGEGLADQLLSPDDEADRKRKFPVQKRWNAIVPHLFDASETCLEAGSTELWVEDPDGAFSANVDTWNLGKVVVLESIPADPALPKRVHRVTVEQIVEVGTDPLDGDKAIAKIRWRDEDATPFQMSLTDLVVRANIVPATAGETICEYFSIGASPDPLRIDEAVERQGHLNDETGERSIIYRYSLKAAEQGGLGFLGEDLTATKPEIHLQEVLITDVNDNCTVPDGLPWTFERTLLEAKSGEDVFTIEDGTWRRVVSFHEPGEEIVHVDYASSAGYTIRFGDGEFGRPPEKPSIFLARYRLSPGASANLADNVITALKLPGGGSDFDLTKILKARNPLPVDNGVDPQNIEEIKRLAPEAYRAVTFRAVRPEDYREAAERLDFVQRASASFRWTGSWLSAFVTVDPKGTFELSSERRSEVEAFLDCFRQAGKELIVSDPGFVSIDLQIHVCVEPFAFRSQIKQRVLEALFGKKGPRPVHGFFDPDNFTFGTPLRRASLEAAIQKVEGVRAVLGPIMIRPRNVGGFTEFFQAAFVVGDNEVIRVQNDARFPERGTVQLIMEGGA